MNNFKAVERVVEGQHTLLKIDQCPTEHDQEEGVSDEVKKKIFILFTQSDYIKSLQEIFRECFNHWLRIYLDCKIRKIS